MTIDRSIFSDITQVIIDFETVNGEPNLQAYDAQPHNPAVHDTTIGIYNLVVFTTKILIQP